MVFYRVKHYFGVVHYDGPIYIDQTWFNGFQTVANQYVGGALGFNPNKDFHDAYSSNVTDIRFGFVDKVKKTSLFNFNLRLSTRISIWNIKISQCALAELFP